MSTQEDEMEMRREKDMHNEWRSEEEGKGEESERMCSKEHEDGADGSEEKAADSAGELLGWDAPPGGRLLQCCVGEEVVSVFERCMEEVEHLQFRRDILVQELLELEGHLQDQVQDLRLQLTHACSLLTHTRLHKHTLQEEVLRVRRRLFSVMRDQIQNQVTLAAQKYEVEQFTYIQEELQGEVLQRLQDLAQLREDQQSRLTALRERLQGRHRPRAASDLSHCRRYSADLSRYTRAGMKSLEEWYEPRLLVLLRRKQTSEDTLRKSKELGQDLKKHLEPLKEESRRMALEREQLQQRINLMEEEKRERLAYHKEMVSSLEECVRELQTELQIQINTNREVSGMNQCLTQQSSVYRRCLGYMDGSDTPDGETECS